MAARKTKEMKHVGFRMPIHLYEEYCRVAEARSIDLTALFLWVLNEFRPMLLLKHAKHQAAMLRAAIEDPQPGATQADEPDMLAATNELLHQMDAVSALLRKRSTLGKMGKAG
jgi:hypothetical protein